MKAQGEQALIKRVDVIGETICRLHQVLGPCGLHKQAEHMDAPARFPAIFKKAMHRGGGHTIASLNRLRHVMNNSDLDWLYVSLSAI